MKYKRFQKRCLAYLAIIAGAKGISIRKKNAFMTGSVCGICIVLLALTIGFVVAANSLHSDGILSVVTFTMAGSLAGGVFFYGKPKTHRTKSVPRPNRKRKERK